MATLSEKIKALRSVFTCEEITSMDKATIEKYYSLLCDIKNYKKEEKSE